MKFLFSILLVFVVTISFAQNETLPPPPEELPGDTATLNKIFERLEVDASIDANKWRSHLTKALGPILKKAAKKGMKAGTYTVVVKFLVEKDGSISKAENLNDPGFGLGKSAADVVLNGPKWKPGEQNGRKVRSYHTQPITFVISEK